MGRLRQQQQQQFEDDDEERLSSGKRSPIMAANTPRLQLAKVSLRGYLVPIAVMAVLGLTWIGGFWPLGGSGDPNELVFISVGDFGVGTPDQKDVAAQMAKTARKHHAQFFISLGDNVYDAGVKDSHDPKLWSCFEDVYHARPLQKQWLMTLGDHDHRGSVAGQIAFSQHSRKWHMPAQYYSTMFDFGRGDAASSLEIFTTDSVSLEALVAAEASAERRFWQDYNMTVSGRKAGRKQLKWLKSSLAQSKAEWKLVVGHRPILTAGVRARYPAEAHFPGLLQPVLESNGVHAYLFGHDHVGQHLEAGGVAYLGSGVGGYGVHDIAPNNATRWAQTSYLGFMLHRLSADKMVTDYIDKSGEVKHTVTLLRKPGQEADTRDKTFL